MQDKIIFLPVNIYALTSFYYFCPTDTFSLINDTVPWNRLLDQSKKVICRMTAKLDISLLSLVTNWAYFHVS